MISSIKINRGIHFGTNVNPNLTLNPLSTSKQTYIVKRKTQKCQPWRTDKQLKNYELRITNCWRERSLTPEFIPCSRTELLKREGGWRDGVRGNKFEIESKVVELSGESKALSGGEGWVRHCGYGGNIILI